MPIPYSSILNPETYAKLRRRVAEGTTASIGATGSEADDPFWQARKAEEESELQKQRIDAYRGLMAQGNAMRSAAQARGEAYQRRATAGLVAQAKQPPSYMANPTTMGQEGAVVMPFQSGAPDPEAQPGVPPSPEVYPTPYSKQGMVQPAYNPSMWESPYLRRMKKKFGTYIEPVARPIV